MKQWLQKHSLSITLLPVLAVMGMIFWFSAQTGESSGALSGRIAAWVVRFFVPQVDAFSPAQQQALIYRVGWIIRKAAHFSEFALLGMCLLLHIRQLKKKIKLSHPWLWSWGVGTVYAVSDELHQHFVGGRHCAISDVCIDSSGVIAGVLLMAGLLCWRRRKCKLSVNAADSVPESLKTEKNSPIM